MKADYSQSKVVILGGGTAGLSLANNLARQLGTDRITLIEPSEHHYYQPWWTLVGGGIVPKERSKKPLAKLLNPKVRLVRERADQFDPEGNRVRTQSGQWLPYDYLIVAPGLQINWDLVEGLPQTLGRNGVCSNYSYDTVDSTWDSVKSFQGGTAIFTFPNTPVKCGGAPQKAMWLAEEYFRKQGLREKTEVIFASASDSIFAVEKYRKTLEARLARQGVKTLFKHNLVAVDGNRKVATFQRLDTGEKVELKFEMLHVSPPMGAPNFVKQSALADAAGWVDVDKHTLQHKRYKNIFAIGDASNLPTSKTGAAIRGQAPVLLKNLTAAMKGEELSARYDGYTSCPLITGRKSCVMAEFKYDGKIAETFPVDQGKERYSMYLVKRYFVPLMYWKAMVKGYYG